MRSYRSLIDFEPFLIDLISAFFFSHAIRKLIKAVPPVRISSFKTSCIKFDFKGLHKCMKNKKGCAKRTPFKDLKKAIL